MSPLATAKDFDKDFVSARIQARREDQLAVQSGKATPAQIQRKNSILPQDFWSEAEINWNAFAIDSRAHS
ncbi:MULTISPECIES: hypothetical protein [unclassified Lentimonas]|uniref:hypothetical protein n=1 Tax=unclassified Lentimonas TaxID=2630993 RepID=UPI00132C34BC|nr:MULTISPECIES: hypothetical protein [unclassified Lentimonas]CAA6678827.1 Unannotated [Lentimonas sp. CC4]CAA6684431.1 Unannotated [Lentimonas sp. CC6]CAA6692824.1 Unannotated [Lentimonas sp. CC19]CAA6695019.1 Unannotated [Lentimonas sp. CC10]CAA7069632.1 Unannotated [Lentimonas sp. CC11]